MKFAFNMKLEIKVLAVDFLRGNWKFNEVFEVSRKLTSIFWGKFSLKFQTKANFRWTELYKYPMDVRKRWRGRKMQELFKKTELFGITK